MKDNALRVVCPSCEAWFEVDDPQLLGQIIPCPKCGGMMLIAAEDVVEETVVGTGTGNEEPDESEPSAANENRDDLPAAGNEPPIDGDEVPNEFEEADEELLRNERDRRRASRALAVTLGLFSAVVFAFVLTFIVRYRDTPEVPAPKPRATSAETASEQGGSESSASPVAPGSESSPEAESAAPDAEPKSEAPETEAEGEASVADVEQGAESEEGETAADASENDSENASETETTDDLNAENAENAESAPEDELLTEVGLDEDVAEAGSEDSWEEEELKSLDESGEPTAEFNKEEFDKANSSHEGEAEETAPEDDWSEVASTTDISSQTAFPILKGEPRTIDVNARLALRVKSITFPKSPAASVRLLSELVDVPIEFDLDEFSLLRASTERTLDLKLDDVDVETALNKLAEHLRWKIDKQEDRVVIRSADDDWTPVEERYDVSDLLGLSAPVLFTDEVAETTDFKGLGTAKTTPEVALEMANVLTPITGDDASASTSIEGTEIVARRNAVDRKNLELLWERVRAMKNVPSKSSEPIESIVPEHLGWLALSRTTSFNLLKPISLQQAIETLENKFRFLALWDDATLNVAGVGRGSTTLARINSATLDQTLYDLLEPLKLTYVILDEKLILITTKEKAETYKTVEIHEFSGLTNASKKPKDALKATIEMTSVVAPESWKEDAAIWIDFESERWLVRQSQPVQREIRRWVSEHKTSKSRGKSPSASRGESESIGAEQSSDVETEEAPESESNENASDFEDELGVELGGEGDELDAPEE